MKGLMVFLVVALVASTNASPEPKSIISDIFALKSCITNALGSIKGSIKDLVSAVSAAQKAITSSIQKLKECQAIGGDNPTVIQQIQQAACYAVLLDKVQKDINTITNDIETSVAELLDAGNQIQGCFSSSDEVEKRVQGKNVIDDVLAIKECLDKAIATIQESVNNVVNVVNDVKDLISTNVAKLNACLAIGGDDPSIIQQIQQATCVLGLVDSIQNDVTTLISNLEASIDQLLHAGDLINECL